ncbi:hypothetical protein ACWF94_10715 [Streptomyces sp. NPDC055078]
MVRRTLAALGTAGALVFGALTACTQSGGSDTSRGAGASGRSGASGGSASAPVAALTSAERAQLDHAEQLLVRECMADRGFPYWVGPPLSADESRNVGQLLDDTAWARRHGYGSRITAKLLARRTADPNRRHRESLSGARLTAYTTALEGGPGTRELSVRVPTGGTVTSTLGGCAAQAEERLYGDRATWFAAAKVATNLSPVYVPKLLSDPRFTAAQSAWAVCMRRAGHDYATPGAIRDALERTRERMPEPRAFAVEVRLAVAEATCARSSGLADTGRRLERHYVDGLRGRYGDELATHSRLERAALTRAREITAR